MEASAINQPHPDDAAEAFFGEPEEQEEQATVNGGEQTVADTHMTAGAERQPEPAVEPEPEASAPTAASTSDSGSLEREYIVFQKAPLTERVLKQLLDAFEKGESPQPHVAYFELHRVVSRNDRNAIAVAYEEHARELPEECDLAAVSARSFKERHVAPRAVRRTNLAIT